MCISLVKEYGSPKEFMFVLCFCKIGYQGEDKYIDNSSETVVSKSFSVILKTMAMKSIFLFWERWLVS